MFWRIFLVLWLGSTALMIGSAVLVALVAERELPEQVRERLSSILRSSARSMLLMHERVPEAEFAAAIRALEREDGIDLYLIDADGRDALGRPVPERLRALAEAIRSGAPPPLSAGIPPSGALAYAEYVADGRGQPRLVLMQVSGPPLPGKRFLLTSMLVPLLFSVMLALLFSAISARYLVKPIEHLRLATRRLAFGALEHRVAATLGARRDEFGALAADFDAMAGRISALIVNQRRLMLDLSHELRSPLARLRVALELLRAPEPRPDLLDRMDRDVDRMDILIGELLLLARLEAQETAHSAPHVALPGAGRLELGALVEDIVEDARLEIAGRERRLTFVPAGTPLAVDGDPELLRRAVENLLRNALQHTADSAEVRVRLHRDGDAACVEVCDRGPGFDSETLREPFVPFMRGDSGGRHRGNGLGLAIARAAVVRHGGTIALRNRSVGGACAELRLPLASDAEAAG